MQSTFIGPAEAVAPVSNTSTGKLQGDIPLFVLGTLWLLLGIVVYVVARPPGTVYFSAQIPNFSGELSHQWRLLLGPVPTFAHTLAFSLMSAALVSMHRNRMLACLVWACVEILFEFAQHPSVSAWLLSHRYQSSSHVLRYLNRGTFDLYDVMAAVAGAALAAAIINNRFPGRQSYEQTVK